MKKSEFIEDDLTELKEKFDDNTLKAICAFANTKGGTIYIGISDKKELKGFDVQNKELERITNKIVDSLGIHPYLESTSIRRSPILKITVKKSSIPISFSGTYYKRVGNTTREMKADELKTYFVKSTNWDAISGDYSIKEIDENTVRKFVRNAVSKGRLEADEKDDIKDVLNRLKLIVDGKITHAAIMLFGKQPQKYFLNAVVRVGRFKDPSTIIGDKVIQGNLFAQAEEAEQAIKSFINVQYEIKGGLERKDTWDYPLEAIREGLLNALIHRDYFKFGVQTQIKVFEDYVWFYNPGGLPEGMTIDKLMKVHSSVPRNPHIMHIFYLAGLVEEYGSGIGRMIELMKEAKLPEPEFSEEMGGFVLTFRKDWFTPAKLAELVLNERQITAVNYVKEKGRITNTEYQKLYNVKKRQASDDLKVLEEKGIFERVGSTGKGTFYTLSKGAPKGRKGHL